jgi:hypothetical protein
MDIHHRAEGTEGNRKRRRTQKLVESEADVVIEHVESHVEVHCRQLRLDRIWAIIAASLAST